MPIVHLEVGPHCAEAHMDRIEVLLAVKEMFKGRPTPYIDAAIKFHQDCIDDTGIPAA